MDRLEVTVILDRLLHNSHVLDIKGGSYWLRDLVRAVTQSCTSSAKMAILSLVGVNLRTSTIIMSLQVQESMIREVPDAKPGLAEGFFGRDRRVIA